MKTIVLSDLEHKILLEFLDQLGEKMGMAGCNDYTINFDPNNEEELTVVKEFYVKHMAPDFPEPDYQTGKMDCSDFVLLEFLKNNLDFKKKNKMVVK